MQQDEIGWGRGIPGGDLPNLDCLISTGADEKVTRRHEADTWDTVIVTWESLDACVGCEVPQLHLHVSRTGDKQVAWGIEAHILHHICVTLQCRLEFTHLVVPHLPINHQWCANKLQLTITCNIHRNMHWIAKAVSWWSQVRVAVGILTLGGIYS